MRPDTIPPEVGYPVAIVLCIVWLVIEWRDAHHDR